MHSHAPRLIRLRRWTCTNACGSSGKQTHTQGFGVLVSICGEAILSCSLFSPSLINSSCGLGREGVGGFVPLWSCDALLLLLEMLYVWKKSSHLICGCMYHCPYAYIFWQHTCFFCLCEEAAYMFKWVCVCVCVGRACVCACCQAALFHHQYDLIQGLPWD